MTTLGVLILLVAPTPARAWWDFIEEFSGPRKFHGPDIQFRLFCLVETDKPVAHIEVKDGQAPQITTSTERKSEVRSPGPFGTLFAVCPVGKDRNGKDEKERLAFDLGVRFMWSTKYKDDIDPAFGNGKTIYFGTIEPAVVFPLVNKSWRLDYGFGAGVYWFSSEGFESFRGMFVEPVRFDVHVPVKGSALIFRVGALVFPAGFGPMAFAGNASHNSRIAAEVVPIYAVAADLTPAARKLTKKLGLNWPDP